MFFSSKRLNERREGLQLLEKIFLDKNRSLIIHYSCESFITIHCGTPRITSICIRYLGTGQTKSFSIHQQALVYKKNFNQLSDSEYDELEKNMLKKFSDFVKGHKKFNWVHWNMRDSKYGFEAIADRYSILGGTIIDIDDDRKFDVPRILSQIYTYNYEKNESDGKLLNLARRKDLTLIDVIKGSDEAIAFDNNEYLKLHQSTVKKVDILDNIVRRAYNNELEVAVRKRDVYGLTIPGIIEIVKNNWVLTALWSLIVYVLGVVSTILLESIIDY